MSTAVEVARPFHLVDCSLDQLAQVANEEMTQCEAHLAQALVHARKCGDALLAARDKMARGSFREWVEANTNISYARACILQRIAFYFEELPEGTASLNVAQQALWGYPAVGSPEADLVADPRTRALAGRWIEDGMSCDDAAESLGIPADVVWKWFDPETLEQRKREAHRLHALKAAARERREDDLRRARLIVETKSLTKSADPTFAKAYSEVRRLLATLDTVRASRREDDPYSYGATCIDEALAAARSCEAGLLDALRFERAGRAS